MRQTITFYKSPEDILRSYADSSIDRRNTYSDWHLVASSRPVFAPPKVKTTYIDVPGGNGALDLSESLTKFPLYENRTGSFTFKVLNHYTKEGELVYESAQKGRWAERYSEIMEFLHGHCLYAVLDDDPQWFYQGRFTVDSWESGSTWSEITIGYNVNPFKWSITSSTSDWLWDPFNFDKDVIRDSVCENIEVNSPDFYVPYQLPPLDEQRIEFDGWSDVSWVWEQEYADKFFGKVPVSPTIIVENLAGTDNRGVDIMFTNEYLGIMNFEQHFQCGTTTYAPDFIFYGTRKTEPYTLLMRGCGKVSIDFRVGRL